MRSLLNSLLWSSASVKSQTTTSVTFSTVVVVTFKFGALKDHAFLHSSMTIRIGCFPLTSDTARSCLGHPFARESVGIRKQCGAATYWDIGDNLAVA